MDYTRIRIPYLGGPDRDAALAASVLGSSETVLEALEAYRNSRRGERGALEVPVDRIEWLTGEHGRLMLRWREELDLACRMERVGEGLSATVGFRLVDALLELEMLAADSLPERVDEL